MWNYEGYASIEQSNTTQILNLNVEDVQCRIHGLKTNPLKWFGINLISIILCGIPQLLLRWFSFFQVIKYEKCGLGEATFILIEDSHGKSDIFPIQNAQIRLPSIHDHVVLRFFIYQHSKYVWSSRKGEFGTLADLFPILTVDGHLSNTKGLTTVDHNDLLNLYGPNTIEIEIKSYWQLFVEEIFNPFYFFQAFSVILWCFDDYLIYAGCVFVLTFFSVAMSLTQTRKQSVALHDLVETSKCHDVSVVRNEPNQDSEVDEIVIKVVDPELLVPGDLIVLPKAEFVLPCDAVLLTGQCIVNESMLTGESVPVTKTSLHSTSEVYSTTMHKRHTLFAGTQMIQSRNYGGENVMARVVKTGFDTTKGALVKSILFPTPVGIQFYKDSLKFVFVLFFIAGLGMCYSLYLYIRRREMIAEIIIRSLDIVTIVVPPALPAAMTVGIVYSQNRLKKLKIFCISPPRINVCGKIKLACFDKTGTLTHDGLDMHSVLPSTDSRFREPIADPQLFKIDSVDSRRLVEAMATCHSLTRIDGRISGDPLDLSMYEFTNWTLEEPGEDETARFDMLAPTIVKPGNDVGSPQEESEFPYEVGIIRQFPFSSTLQCMSVITRALGDKQMTAFSKGAPEKLQTMCDPSTIPGDFARRLAEYAAQGYRVIALGYKRMPTSLKWTEAQRMKRDVVECDLVFLGLLVMRNSLKIETTPVIRTLRRAGIRTVMITGDNILTAISVARECEMVGSGDSIFILETSGDEGNPNAIPRIVIESVGLNVGAGGDHVAINVDCKHSHFAIDGKTWNKIKTFYPDLVPMLLVRTAVFARFQPDQKTQLVKSFQKLDYVVSMVGDGANDCGALKAAHVGVSLSQAEASVAAPFTSWTPDISCIVHLMLEGRCALVTSFAVFKYMALYSLIQFTTVLILYKQFSGLGDDQFLFIDLIITTVLAVTMGRQGPSTKLAAKRPMGSLVSAINLIPLVLQVIVCVLIQVLAVNFLFAQRWYVPNHHNHGGNKAVIVCYENTVLFVVSTFQYVILACVYSKGRPYRQMLITNFLFITLALFLTIVQVSWMAFPIKDVNEFFELVDLPAEFRYRLLLIPFMHLVLAIYIEAAVADQKWVKRIVHWIRRKKVHKNKYKVLLDNNDYQNLLRMHNIHV